MDSQTKLVLLTALITAGSTLIGIAITSSFNLRTARLAKQSEERKHLQSLIINAAIENRRQELEITKISPPGYKYIRPLDDYIVHMIALSELVLDKKLDQSTLAANLTKLEEVLATMDATRAEKYPEYRKGMNPPNNPPT